VSILGRPPSPPARSRFAGLVAADLAAARAPGAAVAVGLSEAAGGAEVLLAIIARRQRQEREQARAQQVQARASADRAAARQRADALALSEATAELLQREAQDRPRRSPEAEALCASDPAFAAAYDETARLTGAVALNPEQARACAETPGLVEALAAFRAKQEAGAAWLARLGAAAGDD
jgi:hypothetical protein